MKLTLKTEWLEPGFAPSSIYDSPFVQLEATPAWPEVAAMPVDHPQWEGSLESFAKQLLEVVETELAFVTKPIHLLASGGYDSRILAYIAEELELDVLYVTDGDEEPTSSSVLDYLAVPTSRRYLHDMERFDPYGLADATVLGWAPIYHQMKFTPTPTVATTLVTGLGGGEWFDYPASGWHRSRHHRLDHGIGVAAMWIDTWPQYWLLPRRWAEGYARALHPYTTVGYASVANCCRPEWLSRSGRYPELDLVREAMLELLDPELAGLGYEPHRYDWRLGGEARQKIDRRFFGGWLYSKTGELGLVNQVGSPSSMDSNEYACLMGGFSQWCDALIAEGHEIEVAS